MRFSESLRRHGPTFVLDDQNAHLLTPSFALAGVLPDPPTYDKMTPEEINAFLTEMESDIRAADRDMIEIEALEKKGITASGKLPGQFAVFTALAPFTDTCMCAFLQDYEKLEPRLKALLKAHEEDARLAETLEVRISSLVDRHATYVRSSSPKFQNDNI